MSKTKHIVHLSYEVSPFFKNGGLGDVVSALPIYLSERYKNTVISFYYKGVMKNLDDSKKEVFIIKVHGVEYEIASYFKHQDGVDYYFLNLEDELIFLENGYTSFDGNLPYSCKTSPIMYLYFAKASLIFIEKKRINVLHLICHDWHSSGVFAYPSLLYNIGLDIKIYVLIHNFGHQGEIYNDVFPFLEEESLKIIQNFFYEYGRVTFLGLAIKYSNYILTVSEGYAYELENGVLPHENQCFIKNRRDEIKGLLNGVDYSIWHPLNSHYLPKPYSLDSLTIKMYYKRKIFQECGFNLEDIEKTPLLLYMCRLTDQKGIQLFYDSADNSQSKALDYFKSLIDLGVKIVIFGTPAGGRKGSIHKALNLIKKKLSASFFYDAEYNDKKAHHFLAGSDITLFPSLFEPCGLVQIYSMAFGTIPIVRPVGGLKDTVNNYSEDKNNPTGFYISELNREALYNSISKAVDIYKNHSSIWNEIQMNCMCQDFSWNKMILNYFELFENAECNNSNQNHYTNLRKETAYNNI